LVTKKQKACWTYLVTNKQGACWLDNNTKKSLQLCIEGMETRSCWLGGETHTGFRKQGGLSRLTWSQRGRKLAGWITQRRSLQLCIKGMETRSCWLGGETHTLASGSREVCQDLLGHKEAGSLLFQEARRFVKTYLGTKKQGACCFRE
jgi:hypothetical protein